MLLLLLACKPDADSPAVDDTAAAPAPWAELTAADLDPLRDLMTTPLTDASAPGRLISLPQRALTFVQDGPIVLVLDPLYHHNPTRHCVSASEWPDWGHEERQGDCGSGAVLTRRGQLIPDDPAVAVAVDAVRLEVVLLTSRGTLQRANADVKSGNPLDYLRLGEPEEQVGPLSPAAVLAVEDGQVAIADGTALWVDGAQQTLPGEALALAWRDGVLWALTDDGLWVDGAEVEASGLAMAVGDDAVWLGDAGAVLRIDAQQLTTERIPVSGATGPLAVHGARVFVAVSDGIAVVEDGAELARRTLSAPVDLAAGPAHEIVALHDSSVQVFLDETALAGADPLSVLVAAFIEQPRNENFDVDCRGEGTTMTTYAEQAAANGPLLSDLPLPTALGITPFFATRAAECDLIDTIAPTVDAADVGVLFHSETPDCDEACIAAALQADMAAVEALGQAPVWASGLAAKDSLEDWASVLQRAEGPDRYLFFGLSSLPDLNHEADPRSKNSWPLEPGRLSGAWRINHADEFEHGVADGWLTVYPGDNIPLFNLGGCANLLLRECHQLGQGGVQGIDETDLTALSLLLHRALADADGPSTFTFHFPDIGLYNYVSGCTVSERRWSGESCQAARMQDWALDVYQRLVLNGLVEQTAVSALPRP